MVLDVSTSPLPQLEAVTHALEQALEQTMAIGSGRVTVLERIKNRNASTYPSEILRCRVGRGRQMRLLYKYSPGEGGNSFGHRGGVAYEAEIYRQVLAPLRASTPRFLGLHRDPATGETWLFIEHLKGSYNLDRSPEQNALCLGARWIGEFHAQAEELVRRDPPPVLTRYDRGYYVGWAQRTSEYAGKLHRRYRWLDTLCRRFEDFGPPLLGSRPTIIHGEYYPHNIRARGAEIRPIDWESAALGAGEIDIAAVTENWPKSWRDKAENEYRQARWGGQPPDDFRPAIGAARLYLGFRWLGEGAEQTADISSRVIFHQLRREGRRLGLL